VEPRTATALAVAAVEVAAVVEEEEAAAVVVGRPAACR
jgi:hypothetical protein